MKAEKMKKSVRERYGKIAQEGRKKHEFQSCCCSSSGVPSASVMVGYSQNELSRIPEEADLGLGCGNPVALASLKKGETVLDLGSGAGIDCFLAADRVGKEGKVIGVDMTHEMLEKARGNAKKGRYTNVEFRLGEIENLPVADNYVDVVISNCVINLVPDKRRAFEESHRVLRPGGRLMVSDIVLLKELPAGLKKSVAAYTACISGALLKEDYIKAIKSAGFKQVKIVNESIYPIDSIASSSCACGVIDEIGATEQELKKISRSIASIKISAIKPAK